MSAILGPEWYLDHQGQPMQSGTGLCFDPFLQSVLPSIRTVASDPLPHLPRPCLIYYKSPKHQDQPRKPLADGGQ